MKKSEEKKNYIDPDEFLIEIEKWQNSAEDPDERIPSNRLGELLLQLHDHILRHQNFSGYRQDLKEEMKSWSLYRIFKRGLKTFDSSKATPFAYFTRAVFLNYYTVLGKYYKRLNNHQEYVKNQLMKLDTNGNQRLEALIKEYKLSE